MRVVMWVGVAAAIAVVQAGDPVRFKFIDTTQQPCAATKVHPQPVQACSGGSGSSSARGCARSECSRNAPVQSSECAKPVTKEPCHAYVDCSGHGSTIDKDRTDGCDCKCHGGYTGNDCHTPPPCSDMDDCSGHGTTRDLDKTDGCRCKCNNGFSGLDCSVKLHSVRNYKSGIATWEGCPVPPPPKCNALTDCNGHGTTTGLKTDGCTCKCQDGYTGDACEVPPPCDANAEDGCSGHGITYDLDKTDGCQCDCHGDWGGSNCRRQICRELHVPGGCDGLDGKVFEMFVKGFDTGHSGEQVLDKWLGFDGAAGHRVLAAYDHKTDAMPLLFQKAGKCNTYKLQNKWAGEHADDKWLGETDGRWIQANSNKDKAATFELVKVAECDETLRGPNHAAYSGCQSQTRSGRICQKWTSQSPFEHRYTPEDRPDSGLGDHNHCRNPDGSSTIWCYTTDRNKVWDFCDPKPQSYKMHVTGRYLNYAVRDHSEDHITGSIEADFTAKDAMTFHLHRDCSAKLPDKRPGWPWWWLFLLIPLVLALACCVCCRHRQEEEEDKGKPGSKPPSAPQRPGLAPPQPSPGPTPHPNPASLRSKPPRRPCRFRWIELPVPLPFCGRVDEGSKTAH